MGNNIDSDCVNQVDDSINEDEDMESILNNTYLEIREFLRKRYDEIGAGCYQIYDVLEGAYEQ